MVSGASGLTEGLGDLIALEWSLTRNRVSGRRKTVGQEEAQSKWEKLTTQPTLLGSPPGHPEARPKEAVSTKGLLHGVFWFGKCFCFFIPKLTRCRFYVLVTCCHSLSVFKGQNDGINRKFRPSMPWFNR